MIQLYNVLMLLEDKVEKSYMLLWCSVLQPLSCRRSRSRPLHWLRVTAKELSIGLPSCQQGGLSFVLLSCSLSIVNYCSISVPKPICENRTKKQSPNTPTPHKKVGIFYFAWCLYFRGQVGVFGVAMNFHKPSKPELKQNCSGDLEVMKSC